MPDAPESIRESRPLHSLSGGNPFTLTLGARMKTPRRARACNFRSGDISQCRNIALLGTPESYYRNRQFVMEDTPIVKAGIFTVRREDWDHFLEMMEDSAENFSTWETWKSSLDQKKIELFNERIDAVEIEVDLDAFENWCEQKGLPRNGASRSRYAAEILQREGT